MRTVSAPDLTKRDMRKFSAVQDRSSCFCEIASAPNKRSAQYLHLPSTVSHAGIELPESDSVRPRKKSHRARTSRPAGMPQNSTSAPRLRMTLGELQDSTNIRAGIGATACCLISARISDDQGRRRSNSPDSQMLQHSSADITIALLKDSKMVR